MANIFRLVLALFAVFPFLVSAQTVPKTKQWLDDGKYYPTVAAACGAYVARLNSVPGTDYTRSVLSTTDDGYCQVSIQQEKPDNWSGTWTPPPPQKTWILFSSVSACPPDYTPNAQGTCDPPPGQCVAPLKKDASGKCSCPAGTTEGKDANGITQCKPDNLCSELSGKPLGLPLNVDYGSKSPGSLGRMIGNSTTTCFTGGCAVSGTVDGCWSAQGVAGCSVTGATFTGDKCDDSKKPGDCPSGSTPSAYAAGVCIPDGNNCPAGSTPSNYASGVCIPDDNKCPSGQVPSKYASGVCVPAGDKGADGNGESGDKSKCPAGQVASRYAAGVCLPADTTVGGGGGGGGTTCKDGKCTTTNPDGSTDEKPEAEYCKEHPDAPQCKKSNWGGQCGSFTCEGDAIQCAIAKEQHQRACKMFDDFTSDEAKAYLDASKKDPNKSVTDNLPGNDKLDFTAGKYYDSSNPLAGGGCITDLKLDWWVVSVSLPFSVICQYLGILKAVLLAFGAFLWVVIVFRG